MGLYFKKNRIIPNRGISFACTGLWFIMRFPFFLNLVFLILQYYLFFTRGKSKVTGFEILLGVLKTTKSFTRPEIL
ncbi:hypothetical protein Barb6_02954 [Bacteroidales bacterium Barb6]|nr:hypothetical protein Barb6_02954 [Bacteroidales bacterium Barb6]